MKGEEGVDQRSSWSMIRLRGLDGKKGFNKVRRTRARKQQDPVFTGEWCFLIGAVQMQRYEVWVLTIKEGYVPKPHGRGLGAECKEVKVGYTGEQKMRVPVRSYETKDVLPPKDKRIAVCLNRTENLQNRKSG